MMTPTVGKYLILMGLLLLAIGVIFYFWGHKFHWIGHLPGDIQIEREGFKLYIPIATMLLLSAVLNLILWLIRRML